MKKNNLIILGSPSKLYNWESRPAFLLLFQAFGANLDAQ
jgi:hypothetical protein